MGLSNTEFREISEIKILLRKLVEQNKEFMEQMNSNFDQLNYNLGRMMSNSL